MKRIETYSFHSNIGQTIRVQSDFEGIVIHSEEEDGKTFRIYLGGSNMSIEEGEEMIVILQKAVAYQRELAKEGL